LVDVKKVAFQYFDKLILIAALGLCAMAGFKRFVSGPPREVQQVKEDIRRLALQVEKNLKTSKAPPLPELKYASEIKKFYALPEKEARKIRIFVFVPPRDIFHRLTLMNRRPWKFTVPAGVVISTLQYDRKVLEIKPGEKKGIIILPRREGEVAFRFRDGDGFFHTVSLKVTPYIPEPQVYEPVIVSAVQRDGTVILRWKRNQNIDERSPGTEFRIYRRKAREGPEKDKMIHKVPLKPVQPGRGASEKEYEFVDKDVAFAERYVYSITTFDPKAKPPESKKAVTGIIEIPSDTEFYVSSVIPGKSAGLKIYKWTREKRWQGPKTFFVKPGEEIGGLDRFSKVDYSTGCVLVSAEQTKVKRLAFGKIVEMPAFRVVYVDRAGVLRMKLSTVTVTTDPPFDRFNPEDGPPQRAIRGRPRKKEQKKRKPEEEEELVPSPEEEEIIEPIPVE